MKITNNISVSGFRDDLIEGIFTESQTIFVPENQKYSARILHMSGPISLKVVLAGEQSECDIKIVYLSNKNNIENIKVEVIHEHKNTVSSQIIKGILTDNSKMIFDGVIRIPFNSQKCDGHQNHRAVLLSDSARVQATPELEIYADDVKCSHGSAVGGLDENALFYLTSRGIQQNMAKKMLLKSYAMELLPSAWESYIDEWMDENV